MQFAAGFCGALLALLLIGNSGIHALEVQEWYSSIIAIIMGSFINVFMYTTQTAKLTSFTDDISISFFIVAGSYVTGSVIASQSLKPGISCSGNPAIDFGLQMTWLFKDFVASIQWLWLYPLMPFAGALLAYVFNELLYKKTLIEGEEMDKEIEEEAEEREVYANYEQEAQEPLFDQQQNEE